MASCRVRLAERQHRQNSDNPGKANLFLIDSFDSLNFFLLTKAQRKQNCHFRRPEKYRRRRRDASHS